MTAPATIGQRIAEVRARVASACDRAGRDPALVTLIAVTKTHPVAAVLEAGAAGVRDVGENRVQEGAAKRAPADVPGLRWHLIGHLQSNKAKPAVETFDILHGLDSVRALEAVDRAAHALDRTARVFIEVNVAGEASKQGCGMVELPALVTAARSLERVRLVGLMTVAPLVADPEAARPIFRALHQAAGAHGLESLSMGMTGDFEVAIEEGATHIRVGRAIFGERAG